MTSHRPGRLGRVAVVAAVALLVACAPAAVAGVLCAAAHRTDIIARIGDREFGILVVRATR